MSTDGSPLLAVLAKTPVSTIDEVFAGLSGIVEALPPDDGIRCFAEVYGEVTADVRATVQGVTFSNPAWLERLDVVFANLFFQALHLFLANDPATPRAWFPLFEARADSSKLPLQFAFAGINAHINRDLPVALVKLGEEMNVPVSTSRPEHGDYVAINPILADVEQRIKARFLTGPVALADELAGKLDDVLANFGIDEARAAAFTNGEALWALRGNAFLSAKFIDTLDGLVGFAGRGLLVSIR
jgi:hypothetical protein